MQVLELMRVSPAARKMLYRDARPEHPATGGSRPGSQIVHRKERRHLMVGTLRTWFSALVVLATSALYGCFLRAQPGSSYEAAYLEPQATVVIQPPPPVRVEVQPAPPSPGRMWVAGYWHWAGADWTWRGGRWEQPRAGYAWAPPRYEPYQGRYRYAPGHWTQRARYSQPRPPAVVVQHPRPRVYVQPSPRQRQGDHRQGEDDDGDDRGRGRGRR